MSRINPVPLRLREARLRLGISQRNLGIQIGMDPGSASGRMNHYEKGRHSPDIDTLSRLAEALDVPLSYFFYTDETSAQLACVIEKMTEKERKQLLKSLLKNYGGDDQ